MLSGILSLPGTCPVLRGLHFLGRCNNGRPEPSPLPGNLVAQFFAGDDCNLLTDTLVGVEVIPKTSIVFLNYDPGSLFHSLGSHTTLDSSKKIVTVQ